MATSVTDQYSTYVLRYALLHNLRRITRVENMVTDPEIESPVQKVAAVSLNPVPLFLLYLP